MQDVMNKMGASDITIAYGLTETSPVFFQTKVDDPIELKVSTVGQVHPHVEAKIIDPDTKEECGPNETGELITRGDRKSTRLNSSHVAISYAVFCLKKKN